jgi:hypothetical protein
MKACALVFWSLLAVALAFLPASASADEPDIIAAARALGIARSIEWQRLVHYRPGAWGSPVSEVDGKEFFLAKTGKHDPEAELVATLSAFMAPVVAGHEDDHALCRFPARRLLLDGKLDLEGVLPTPKCHALARYEEAVDPSGVSIVYSANYLANPASALGHTLLRLKKRRPAGSTLTSEQLDFGIDFIATTDTKNPFLYAFKGLTGLFPGVFRFHSYQYKIREYGNAEARDLWEYDLALTPRELKLLALHLWELEATHIDYFYLTENCSYQILATVEAVAPRVDLISGLNALVLPTDTIKALFTIPGLVADVHYRPSLRSQFRAQVALLAPREKDMAERLTVDPRAPLPSEFSIAESVRTLDVAVDVLDARFAKPVASGTEDADVTEARAVLVERRALLSTSLPPPPPNPAPVDKAPERGNGSMRVTLGTGVTTQYRDAFATLGYRLVLHDLADPPDGEPELSQVQFFDTQVRYDPERSSLTLDRLTFAELLALNPITRFEKAFSWRLQAFGTRLHDRDCPDGFAHGLDGALGGTLATENEHAALFLMADGYVAFSGALDGIEGSVVRVGVGPFAGLRLRLPADTIAVLMGTVSYLPGERLRATYDVHATVRTSLGRNVALGVESVAQPSSAEIQLASYLYF